MIEYSREVLTKARALADNPDHLRADLEFDNIWWVVSSNGEHIYRVQADYDREARTVSWITCTCPHGLNSGAGQTHCYHAAAILLTLRDEGRVE